MIMILRYTFVILSFSIVSCRSRTNNYNSQTSSYLAEPEVLFKTHRIEVCWENQDPGTLQAQTVRNAIESEYNAKTIVKFFGWEKCHDVSQGIRIYVYNSGFVPSDNVTPKGQPRCTGFGAEIASKKAGMIFNFSFEDVSESLSQRCKNKTQTIQLNCIANTAIHEFGHALGFLHEQDRPDSECEDFPGTREGYLIGKYDPDSVMNYCLLKKNNEQARISLSPGDIYAINLLYEDPINPPPLDHFMFPVEDDE